MKFLIQTNGSFYQRAKFYIKKGKNHPPTFPEEKKININKNIFFKKKERGRKRESEVCESGGACAIHG